MKPEMEQHFVQKMMCGYLATAPLLIILQKVMINIIYGNIINNLWQTVQEILLIIIIIN